MSTDTTPELALTGRPLTPDLITDVFHVLEQHGYHRPTETGPRDQATGGAVYALLRLAAAYEGADQW